MNVLEYHKPACFGCGRSPSGGNVRYLLLMVVSIVALLWPMEIVWAQTAAAQSGSRPNPKLPVKLRLEPLSIRGRSGSAIPIRIKLEYNAPQMLSGDLVLEVYNSMQSSDDLMVTLRYEGIVLQGSDYIFNAILPPIEHSYNKQYLVVGWFETPTNRIPLTADPDLIDPPEPHELLSIGSYERATLICSCSGERDYLRASKNRSYLNNVLSLDNYNPVLTPADATDQRTNTQRGSIDSNRVQNYTVGWDALNLPEDPLYLCSFDMVLLADNALSRLEDRQLQALLTWVEAGGSLCVVPDDKRLTKNHLQFLQTLFERDSHADLHLSLNDDGTLLVISDSDTPIAHRQFGLGRVTLLPVVPDLSSRLTAEELGRTVAHLWKVRRDSPVWQGQRWQPVDIRQAVRDRGQSIVTEGSTYRLAGGNSRYGHQQFGSLDELARFHGLGFELQPRANPLSSICETALLPMDISMVPTYVIILLLAAYVITIGPVDYIVLGYFRMRRLTWVLFPLVTAAFTMLTLYIAHRYMATNDTGGMLTITDLVDDGRPIRETKIRMHFYSGQTTVKDDVTTSFTVPAQMLIATDIRYGAPQGPRATSRGIQYSGRFPQAYSTAQQMRQWEPQLIRGLTLSPKATDIPVLPWNDASMIVSNEGRGQLAATLKSLADIGEIDAVILHKQERYSLFPANGFLFSSSVITAGQNWLNMDQWQQRSTQIQPEAITAHGLLQAASRSGTRDYFSLVSQIAPQGSASMEDLPLLDSTDDRQWLLMVAVRKAGRLQIYRRLYVLDELPK